MNQFTVLIPTLADVGATIANDRFGPAEKRDALTAALRSLENWSGKNLKDIGATVPGLAALFETIQPAALGIRPKTLANTKSLCLKALTISELTPGIVRTVSRGQPKGMRLGYRFTMR
jgi:hypothetical protein